MLTAAQFRHFYECARHHIINAGCNPDDPDLRIALHRDWSSHATLREITAAMMATLKRFAGFQDQGAFI